MTRRAIALAAIALVAALVIGWLAYGRTSPATIPAANAVSGGGITLVSDSIVLPEEKAVLPAGSDLISATCTACHSAEMLTTQPALNAEKWQATIDKMRKVYKASIDPAQDKALIAELTALPTQRPAASPAKAGAQ